MLACLWLTVAIEVVTLILRFGFALESTRDTASTIGVLTFGIRIHHGYIGAVMIPLGLWQHRRNRLSLGRWIYIIGVALFLSDMIHHFLVLWPITGSPHFHLVYPTNS